MLGLWLIFMFMVFVLEPLLLDKVEEHLRRDPDTALGRISRLHQLLLLLAGLTAFGAVAGAHGFAFF